MSDAKRPSKKHKKSLLKVVVPVVILVALVVAVGGFLLWRKDAPTPDEAKADEQTLTADTIESSQELKYKKDYDQAADQTSQQFEAATNAEGKYVLALQTASAYESKPDCQAAIEWYQKAYELQPEDRAALSGLGRCYDETGDKVKAAEFYRKTIEAINPDQVGASNDIDFYKDLLAKAEAGQ